MFFKCFLEGRGVRSQGRGPWPGRVLGMVSIISRIDRDHHESWAEAMLIVKLQIERPTSRGMLVERTPIGQV